MWVVRMSARIIVLEGGSLVKNLPSVSWLVVLSKAFESVFGDKLVLVLVLVLVSRTSFPTLVLCNFLDVGLIIRLIHCLWFILTFSWAEQKFVNFTIPNAWVKAPELNNIEVTRFKKLSLLEQGCWGLIQLGGLVRLGMVSLEK